MIFGRKKKENELSSDFWYTFSSRRGDKEQYTDDLEFQIRHADLTIDDLEELKAWLWDNSETRSNQEISLHFNKLYSGVRTDVVVAHFCGADEFARLLKAVDLILQNP